MLLYLGKNKIPQIYYSPFQLAGAYLTPHLEIGLLLCVARSFFFPLLVLVLSLGASCAWNYWCC
jgi:hypothetical protein